MANGHKLRWQNRLQPKENITQNVKLRHSNRNQIKKLKQLNIINKQTTVNIMNILYHIKYVKLMGKNLVFAIIHLILV